MRGGSARTKDKGTDSLLRPGEIAVICHKELDAVAAAGLADSGAAAVINARHSLSCRYPNLGPASFKNRDSTAGQCG